MSNESDHTISSVNLSNVQLLYQRHLFAFLKVSYNHSTDKSNISRIAPETGNIISPERLKKYLYKAERSGR